MSQPTVALLNDTSLYSSHFGCRLVCQAFREQFARCGLQLKVSLPLHFEVNEVDSLLSKVDLVVVNGEGSVHHGRNLHLVELADRFPTVLVNCVFQENPVLPALKSSLYVSARESLSAAALQAQGVEADVTPDAIFASSLLRSYVKPGGTKKEIGFTDNVTDRKKRVGLLRRKMRTGFTPECATIKEYLDTLCSYNRLCIGRFHAVCAATILEIPFATWDSNTWKAEGLMRDMGMSHLHFKDQQSARLNVPQTFDPRFKEFSDAALGRVMRMFDHIAEIARRQQA